MAGIQRIYCILADQTTRIRYTGVLITRAKSFNGNYSGVSVNINTVANKFIVNTTERVEHGTVGGYLVHI